MVPERPSLWGDVWILIWGGARVRGDGRCARAERGARRVKCAEAGFFLFGFRNENNSANELQGFRYSVTPNQLGRIFPGLR